MPDAYFRNDFYGVVTMNKKMCIEMEVDFSGVEFVELDTGTNEINDVEIENVCLFGRDWTERELRAEFGKLAEWIYSAEFKDDGDWE